MKIKICGLKRQEDIDYVNRYQPDFAGFVFAGKKRRIDFDTAVLLRGRLTPSIPTVGVFIDEDPDFILRLVREHVIQFVQLHGNEDLNYVTSLKEKLAASNCSDTPLIKAIRVKESSQVLTAQELPVDYLLLDAFSEKEYGGTGKQFNHDLIPRPEKPYFLAGGIDWKNVSPILHTLKEKKKPLPYCVDVSSSLETDGVKDVEKIRQMVEAVTAIRM